MRGMLRIAALVFVGACVGDEARVEGISDCPEGQQPCAESCVDTNTDPAHCGACGVACTAEQICALGNCATPCGNGGILCGSDCAVVDSSADHCGGCDQPCNEGEICVSGKCFARTCRDLLQNDPALADGLYFIDPDGPQGEPPFEVACNMSTDGGGWIELSLDDTQNLLMAQHSAANPWSKCADDASVHFGWVSQANVNADFEGAGEYVVPLGYLNPVSDVVYTAEQVDALRTIVTELSTTTRMVAMTADDDNGDWQTTMMIGHEVYIKGASLNWVLLTPGEDGDCGGSGDWPLAGSTSGFYLWHSTAAGSNAQGSTVDDLPGLGIGDLLPLEARLVVHSGGGVAFGWEKRVFLVR